MILIKKFHSYLQEEFGHGENRPYYREKDFYDACLIFAGLAVALVGVIAVFIFLFKVHVMIGLALLVVALIMAGVGIANA
jgi:hypothetical protein